MQSLTPFHFEYSYLSLPEKFYTRVKPELFPAPEILLLNGPLCDELPISKEIQEYLIASLVKERSPVGATTFAQAYAGHQFGFFTNLGDGRAIILGEHVNNNQQKFDIQLKGSGRTPYSRNGDGKATLKAMLREYLISEAMHGLNIPTSRSLAVIKTGEPVYRETMQEGAALVRVMKSHIRVGTFEYAAHFGTTEDLKALTTYTIKRLYPTIAQDENPVVSFLHNVMVHQIALVAHWMRVGFIHGVMNTDNISISAETFDYGPCAFINTYHPDTVFSSIDHNGRYAFGHQPPILKWNIARFAEALLPVLHPDKDTSLQLAQSAINSFDEIWNKQFYSTMLHKIGIESPHPAQYKLVDELLDLMQRLKLDYTNTFLTLSEVISSEDSPINSPEFQPWLEKWRDAVEKSCGMLQAKQWMNRYNPAFIPRNHLVEQALEEAIEGNGSLYQKMVDIVSQPYQYQPHLKEFMDPPASDFERSYQTFCGT